MVEKKTAGTKLGILALVLALACPGTLKGFWRMVLVTAPLLRQLVHTRMVLFVPFLVVTFTRCRLGLNFRRAMPVIFVPTPPRYLALPRVSTVLPICVPLPQISHTRARGEPL